MNPVHTTEPAAPAAFVTPADAGDRAAVLGMDYRYVARSAATGGLTVIEIAVPPGAAAPMHVHAREDEILYVLEGEIVVDGIGVAGSAVAAGPGALCFAPRGRRHAFRNDGAAPARVLVVASPGDGLERMFGALAALPPDGLAAAPAICADAGVTLLG